MTIFLVDLDGVVCDMIAGINERLPRVGIIPREVTDYSFTPVYTEDEVAHIRAILRTPGFFRSLPPIPGSADGVLRLLYHGKVFFVSSWMPEAPWSAAEKIEWVRDNFGKAWEDKVILTQDKTTVIGNVLIDDKPEICGQFRGFWDRWIYDQPYNQEVYGPRMTWETLEDIIQQEFNYV